jgi:hypothetical protein
MILFAAKIIIGCIFGLIVLAVGLGWLAIRYLTRDLASR